MRTMIMLMMIALSPLLQAVAADKVADKPADKPTCAVLPFKAMGSLSAGMAEILAERVFFEIAKSGRYQMIERTQVERTLKENQISTIVSDTAGIEAGRLLGSKYVVIGSVGQLGALTTMNSRIVNVETGEIVTQAANDHEGRVEEMLQVAEKSARELLGTGPARPVPPPPPVQGEPKTVPGGDYKAVAINPVAPVDTAPVAPVPATGGAAAIEQPVLPPAAGGVAAEGQPLSLDLGEGVRMDFVWIAAGQFPLGGGTRGRITTIPRGFWMGKYEVQNGQYQRFIAATGYNGLSEGNRNHLEHIQRRTVYAGSAYPVIWVNWLNATSFCSWLTRQGQVSGQIPATARVRLPSEAEWEYACRAGTITTYYTGNRAADLSRAAWWEDTAGRHGPKPCGMKEANAWGLYDMLGNAAEWVDGQPGEGRTRSKALRGGAWAYDEDECTGRSRVTLEPVEAKITSGFRVVISIN